MKISPRYPLFNIKEQKIEHPKKEARANNAQMCPIAFSGLVSLASYNKIKVHTDEDKSWQAKTSGVPIYSIDKNNNYQRFETQAAASRTLGVPLDGISDCINGKLMTSGNLAFVRAADVEVQEEEEIQVNTDLLDSFSTFLRRIDGSVYAIDKDGNYLPYKNANMAAKDLDLHSSSIFQCLKGNYKTTGGYTFVFSTDIETIDEDGKAFVDKEKLEAFMTLFDTEGERGQIAIYAIDKNGNYTKFKSQREAARELNIDRAAIFKCLNGSAQTAKGFIFVPKEMLEIENENGEIEVSKEKLKEAMQKFESPEKVIYAISKDGNYTRYKDQKEAALALNMTTSRISACVTKKRNRAGDYTFVRASEILTQLPDGTTEIDPKKIKKIAKKLQGNEVYAIDGNGVYQKFKTAKQAAIALGISEDSISNCFSGRCTTAHNYKFVKAYDIETKDDNGNIEVNEDKILEIMKNLQKRALYVINEDGSFERQDSKWHAARNKKGMCFDRLLMNFYPVNGYMYVMANKVETINDDRSIDFSESKLNEEFEKLRKQAIYVVDDLGNCQRFNTRSYAMKFSDAFTYNKKLRRYILNNGFKVVRAVDVETKDKNGLYHFDPSKLEIKKLHPSYPNINCWNKE